MKKVLNVFFCGALLMGAGGAPVMAQQEVLPEPMQTGEYEPSWESLAKYECPEWFRDAKFGIWAHWGPQCEPESGDWYARHMYYPGEWQYNVHLQKYGNPKDFGFKDVIHVWEAGEWEPDSLIRFYKSVGARYFMALANHHDNFDLWDSKYQPWNSVNMGPKRNIIGEWAAACEKYGLPLGVSIHASHAWTWMEGAQAFDGKLTLEDGKGKWWEGYDPQDLYEQRHERSAGSENVGTIHSQWEWGNGASQPSEAYRTKLYNRSLDLINRYHPDLIYFDDTAVPFYPVSDEGLKILTHMYNKSLADHNGEMRAVVMGKKLTEEQKDGMLWDVERGIPDRKQDEAWQTCTCLGQWHYDRGVYDRNGYKSAATVVKMLVDIVSKNGNLLLSVPVRGNGTIDEKEVAILEGIRAWMDINGESIYGTRPWSTFGEGPSAEASNPINNQGFNEGTNYTAEDIRYVEKDGAVYVTALGWPSDGMMEMKSLSAASPYIKGKVSRVELLGYGDVPFGSGATALSVTLPELRPNGIAPVLKVTFSDGVTYGDLQALLEPVEAELERVRPLTGVNSGQYLAESVERLQAALDGCEGLTGEADTAVLSAAYTALQTAWADFVLNGQVKGGAVTEAELTQNVTARYLVEARHFARTDEPEEGATRFGLLADPWVVTSNIINKDNNTHGGFDSYQGWNDNSGRAIGIQKWDAWEAAIEDGMIYQTTTLPAGDYSLRMAVHEQAGLAAGEVYLLVAEGSGFLSGDDVEGRALAAFDMSGTATGKVENVCGFTLEAETTVSIGWHVDIPAGATARSMRVSSIRLLRDGQDVSADYLGNYDNIRRKDVGYKRFGSPENWKTANFRIPQSNSDGVKQGIDKYNGYNALMMGVWDDLAAAEGDMTSSAIYREVRLPAGTYFFGAAYESITRMQSAHVFVSAEAPVAGLADRSCLARSPLRDAAADGGWYGVKFTLPTDSTVCLGWLADFTLGETRQEFRVEEVALLRYLDAEGQWLESEALRPAEGVLRLTAAQWAGLAGGSLGMSSANEDYVVMDETSEVRLGQADLTGIDRVEVEAEGGDGPAECRFLIDGEAQPWTAVALAHDGRLSGHQPVSADCPATDGVHDVVMRVNGTGVKVFSVSLIDDEATSVDGIVGTEASREVRMAVSGRQLTLYGLQAADVRVYGMGGGLVALRKNAAGTLVLSLPGKGVYIVSVDGKGRKVVVSDVH